MTVAQIVATLGLVRARALARQPSKLAEHLREAEAARDALPPRSTKQYFWTQTRPEWAAEAEALTALQEMVASGLKWTEVRP